MRASAPEFSRNFIGYLEMFDFAHVRWANAVANLLFCRPRVLKVVELHVFMRFSVHLRVHLLLDLIRDVMPFYRTLFKD